MLTIWKEVLQLVPVQQVALPAGAEILCAREQHEAPCIWFRCDPHAAQEARTIALVGTGHDAPSAREGRYLGTCSLQAGSLILHVFERRSQSEGEG